MSESAWFFGAFEATDCSYFPGAEARDCPVGLCFFGIAFHHERLVIADPRPGLVYTFIAEAFVVQERLFKPVPVDGCDFDYLVVIFLGMFDELAVGDFGNRVVIAFGSLCGARASSHGDKNYG